MWGPAQLADTVRGRCRGLGCRAAQRISAIALHVPAALGRAGRAAAGGQAAVHSPARASAAADRDTAAEKAVVGTVAAGSAAVDHIPAGLVAGETCGVHRYLPTLEARPPPVLAVPDVGEEAAVAAGAEVRAAAGTHPGLAAHRTRVRVRAVAGSKPLLEATVQLPAVVTRILRCRCATRDVVCCCGRGDGSSSRQSGYLSRRGHPGVAPGDLILGAAHEPRIAVGAGAMCLIADIGLNNVGQVALGERAAAVDHRSQKQP